MYERIEKIGTVATAWAGQPGSNVTILAILAILFFVLWRNAAATVRAMRKASPSIDGNEVIKMIRGISSDAINKLSQSHDVATVRMANMHTASLTALNDIVEKTVDQGD